MSTLNLVGTEGTLAHLLGEIDSWNALSSSLARDELDL